MIKCLRVLEKRNLDSSLNYLYNKITDTVDASYATVYKQEELRFVGLYSIYNDGRIFIRDHVGYRRYDFYFRNKQGKMIWVEYQTRLDLNEPKSPMTPFLDLFKSIIYTDNNICLATRIKISSYLYEDLFGLTWHNCQKTFSILNNKEIYYLNLDTDRRTATLSFNDVCLDIIIDKDFIINLNKVIGYEKQ